MDNLIINAALTGMIPTKADNPALPVTPDEIAADARRCRDAGASIVHLHARGQAEADSPTWRKEIYRDIVRRVRQAAPDLVVCVSTSGRLWSELDKRTEALTVPGVDMGSLALGSMNFPTGPSVNSPETIQVLAQQMNLRGIRPELEIFDLGMVSYAHYLINHNILTPPYYFNLFLGSLGTLSAVPANLTAMLTALPGGAIWAATGVGRYQFEVNCWAIAMGGHVRVGLEDSLYMDAGKTDLATNVRLVERLVKVARAMGREIATPEEVRRELWCR